MSFLQFISNAQLNARAAAGQSIPQVQLMSNLAAFVRRCWSEAKQERDQRVLARLHYAQQARAGVYDSAKLADIRAFGGSEEYARITANKCRIAESWVRDIYLGQTERPWTIAPTPNPQMPEESTAKVAQQVAEEFAMAFATSGMADPKMFESRADELLEAERQRMVEGAKRTAANMERLMQDQLAQGCWDEAIAQVISDLVTFPAAHLKGPIIRAKDTVEWGSESNGWKPVVKRTVAPEFRRVDPMRIFPAPGATNPQEGYIIELTTLSRGELYDLIGQDGYDENAIREVLQACERGSLTEWTARTNLDTTSLDVANSTSATINGAANTVVDVIEYHGPIKGAQLIEWGMSEADVEDRDKDYEACVWLIGPWVIKAQLNYDPLGVRPYYKASYEDIAGSYWGYGIPDILKDMQGITNAAIRALANNAAMAAGPLIGVQVDRLAPGETLKQIHPMQIYQFNESKSGVSDRPIDFFQPESRIGELLAVIEKTYELADNFSMIPRVMAGDGQGVSRTATGLSMLLESANKGLKSVIGAMDMNILSPALEALFNYNMLFSTDETVRGDVKVVARGALSLMQQEALQLRRNEFLAATNNPLDAQVVGIEGRAEIIREVAKGLDIDTQRIIPPRGVLQAQQQAQQMQQQFQQGAMPEPGNTLGNGAAVTNSFGNNGMRATQ